MNSRNLYYSAVYDDIRIANNMVGAVNDNLTKFERYLELAIRAMREKEQITATWEKVEDPMSLHFEPLAYEITVRASSTIEVYMEESYLELNVQNGIPLDTTFGIRLDDWSMLQESQVEVITLSSSRSLMKLQDPSLYNGEKQASTKNGSIASITTFNIVNLAQDGNTLHIINKSYQPARGCYRFSIEGELDEDKELSINGFFIEQQNWNIISVGGKVYSNEQGEIVPIKAIQGNKLFVDRSYPKPKALFSNGVQFNYTVKDIAVPQTLDIGSDSIRVERKGEHYTTLGNSSVLEDGFIHNHPEFGFPMFRVTQLKERSSGKHRGLLAIRLKDETEDEDFFSKSPIDYFFDQDTETLEGVLGDRRVRITVKNSSADERILYVASENYKQKLEYNDIPEVLSIKVNTSQLDKQRRAVQRLKNVPLVEHLPLVKLSQKKASYQLWPSFALEEIQQWFVLTDPSRDGVVAQREFVQKALSTLDFSLLEGPPGSGKTTTILELILQLIKRGKRIMLCGSTHVAIDNVLERLKSNNLLDGVFPLRIGKRESISEDITEFCLDQYTGHKYFDLLVESANLVCATTVGILQHPFFQLMGDQPANPMYDYLIIDESSKTTFQEFLIPAMFAKKWILVGDIKQLPPYNEREQIIAGIDDNQKLHPSLKKACLLIYQYIYNFRVRMPVCIVESAEVIQAIQEELTASRREDIKKAVAVVNEEIGTASPLFLSISEQQLRARDTVLWGLNGVQVLFVNEKLLEHMEQYIPNHMVVIKENWENSSQHYQVNAYYQQHPLKLYDILKFTWKEDRHRDKLPIDFLLEQKRFFKEKTWASEYGWRVVRIFELENVENSRTKANYKQQLGLLSPKTASPQSLRDIEVVGDVALPSILQALQEGVGKNRDGSLDTTLNSGFDLESKKNRFVTLDYQHRMHPDISKFPRKQFYQDFALQNSHHVLVQREWTYSRYPARNIWLDVVGKMSRSSNAAEVTALIRELKRFIEWANVNRNTQNESGQWEVACLSFYNKQRELIAAELNKLLPNGGNKLARFSIGNVEVKNYTVDKFQGQEADLTFISMVRTDRGMGFMDNPNRLNVAITRARFQRVIIGKHSYFLSNNDQSEQLNLLARDSFYMSNS